MQDFPLASEPDLACSRRPDSHGWRQDKAPGSSGFEACAPKVSCWFILFDAHIKSGFGFGLLVK